jgi:CubicO group peptidase (beta-lactamase class C family)
VTIRHLLTHVSGLPDQLANNNELRKQHAPLTEFARQAMRTRLAFAPGGRYQYSSMGILLAARIAEKISGSDIRTLVERTVLEPLGSTRLRGWDGSSWKRWSPARWNAPRPNRGAAICRPGSGTGTVLTGASWAARWGGTHASAPDVGKFLGEFLGARGQVLKPETARLMIKNHNPAGLTPRGLGFAVGKGSGSRGCSEQTFGHTGSTSTLCWADPASETICVVLTSLPGRALERHPRELTAERVAMAARH